MNDLYHQNTSVIKAILGPTNTGKTYYAIERMLAYTSGVISSPLRLLARENYDKIRKLTNPEKVALITGEEKIIPEKAKYFCCTTESMPMNKSFDFVAIDEIQLASDFERGHIFTDKILNVRGKLETLFLGAETIKDIIKILIPNIIIEGRSRFSKLSYIGRKKVTRIVRRSAIVAFSAADVYTIADVIKRQLGGAAIVMGALSPRTRNSQVEMYESGEVDYLVATDAIGMGLNLKIDNINFISLKKFDGRILRMLTDPEIAQIAGRAGRYLSDGTFGISENSDDLSMQSIDNIENSNFESIRRLYWRNSNLDYSSLKSLEESLEVSPKYDFLIKKTDAEDHHNFLLLRNNNLIKKLATNQKAIELLWDVSQVPEFSKTLTNYHEQLLLEIYKSILSDGRLNNDFINKQITRLDNKNGEIDTLMQRISSIRTWTYLSHKSDWMTDAETWQEQSLTIEDKLSDALNVALTERFVDKRTATFVKNFREKKNLDIKINSNGSVNIENYQVGIFKGFMFELNNENPKSSNLYFKSIRKILEKELLKKVKLFYSIPNENLSINNNGKILWDNNIIASLSYSESILNPKIEIYKSELLNPASISLILERVDKFIKEEINTFFQIFTNYESESLSSTGRALIFRLIECLGNIKVSEFKDQIKELQEGDKKQLTNLGIRFGVKFIYIPNLLKPRAMNLRAILWAIKNQKFIDFKFSEYGKVSYSLEKGIEDKHYNIIGYSILADRVIRVDMIERLLAIIRSSARGGKFNITEEMLSIAGCSKEYMIKALETLGYEIQNKDQLSEPDKLIFIKKKIVRKNFKFHKKDKKLDNKNLRRVETKKQINKNSPFAILQNFEFNKK